MLAYGVPVPQQRNPMNKKIIWINRSPEPPTGVSAPHTSTFAKGACTHDTTIRMLNDDMPEGIHIVVNGSGKSRHARTAQRSLL